MSHLRETRLSRRGEQLAEFRQALDLGEVLFETAQGILDQTAAEIHDGIQSLDSIYASYVPSERHGGDRGHWFRWQVGQSAKQLSGYCVDIRTHHAWTRLAIRTATQTGVVVLFHSLSG